MDGVLVVIRVRSEPGAEPADHAVSVRSGVASRSSVPARAIRTAKRDRPRAAPLAKLTCSRVVSDTQHGVPPEQEAHSNEPSGRNPGSKPRTHHVPQTHTQPREHWEGTTQATAAGPGATSRLSAVSWDRRNRRSNVGQHAADDTGQVNGRKQDASTHAAGGNRARRARRNNGDVESAEEKRRAAVATTSRQNRRAATNEKTARRSRRPTNGPGEGALPAQPDPTN